MKKFWIEIVLATLLISCHHKQATTEAESATTEDSVQTPVTITSVTNEPLVEYADLNATSSFLQSSIVKSNINGYITAVNTKMGEFTGQGKVLFVVKTKEAESLGNTINKLDPSFHFSGVVSIHASQGGYITQLDHQAGDYVQDGEQLAVISNSNSFGFILNVPYELRPYVAINKQVEVILPDNTHLTGTVSSLMPSMDSVSQTQAMLVKVKSSQPIPQNLIARVRIVKVEKNNVPSLPKEAILSDEAQTNFWVMKMTDSVTAVKVPIIRGLETDDRVEIVRPVFLSSDKILLKGNYGLPDTAKVKVVKSLE